MEIISKKKNKDATTTYNFGDKKAMVDKVKKIATSTGYMVKPKLNPNLKISSPELARKESEKKGKYYKWNENIRKGKPEKNLK